MKYYQGDTHLRSRDALPEPDDGPSSFPIFRSSVSAYHSALWPGADRSKITRNITAKKMVDTHKISPKNCARRYPNSRVQCFVLPRAKVVPNWQSLDVLVYLGQYITQSSILAPRVPWQKRAVVNMESSQYWPHLTHPDMIREYDIHAGIHRSSIDTPDLQIMFEEIGSPEDYNSTLPKLAQYTYCLINYVSSNCISKNHREAYVQELMKHMTVDSYGACLHTKDIKTEKPNGWRDVGAKRKLQSNYMFSLALENANERDWVTEKLFDPLISGSIPVYMGAENVDEYLPCPKHECIIKTQDFPNPRDLAAHLKHISENEDLFDTYHAWRTRPLSENFIRLTELNYRNYQCAICEHVARGLAPDSSTQPSPQIQNVSISTSEVRAKAPLSWWYTHAKYRSGD